MPGDQPHLNLGKLEFEGRWRAMGRASGRADEWWWWAERLIAPDSAVEFKLWCR